MMDSTDNPIYTDPDFVALKRHDFSLKKVKERYPTGCPTHVIAQALEIPAESVEPLYEKIVEKLRSLMKDP